MRVLHVFKHFSKKLRHSKKANFGINHRLFAFYIEILVQSLSTASTSLLNP